MFPAVQLDSYWLPGVISKRYEGSADVDQQRFPADDPAVKTVDVLGGDTEHHISAALWTKCCHLKVRFGMKLQSGQDHFIVSGTFTR